MEVHNFFLHHHHNLKCDLECNLIRLWCLLVWRVRLTQHVKILELNEKKKVRENHNLLSRLMPCICNGCMWMWKRRSFFVLFDLLQPFRSVSQWMIKKTHGLLENRLKWTNKKKSRKTSRTQKPKKRDVWQKLRKIKNWTVFSVFALNYSSFVVQQKCILQRQYHEKPQWSRMFQFFSCSPNAECFNSLDHNEITFRISHFQLTHIQCNHRTKNHHSYWIKWRTFYTQILLLWCSHSLLVMLFQTFNSMAGKNGIISRLRKFHSFVRCFTRGQMNGKWEKSEKNSNNNVKILEQIIKFFSSSSCYCRCHSTSKHFFEINFHLCIIFVLPTRVSCGYFFLQLA